MPTVPNPSTEDKKARQRERVKRCTERIVQRFERGDLPEKLAPIFIHRDDGRPCRAWSWRNQLLVALEGFDDARTYKAWDQVGRQVRKGQRAFYILEPCRFKVTDTDDSGEKTERMVCRGFKGGARFGYEQTDGDELPYKRDDRVFVDGLPLVEVARAWGLSLGCFNGATGKAQGWFRHTDDKGLAIALGVKNVSTWAHELIHCADLKCGALVKARGQELSNEVVAELGSAVLLTMLGRDHDADLGGAFQYVKTYCDRNDADLGRTCLRLLDRVCNAVSLILKSADDVVIKAVA